MSQEEAMRRQQQFSEVTTNSLATIFGFLLYSGSTLAYHYLATTQSYSPLAMNQPYGVIIHTIIALLLIMLWAMGGAISVHFATKLVFGRSIP